MLKAFFRVSQPQVKSHLHLLVDLPPPLSLSFLLCEMGTVMHGGCWMRALCWGYMRGAAWPGEIAQSHWVGRRERSEGIKGGVLGSPRKLPSHPGKLVQPVSAAIPGSTGEGSGACGKGVLGLGQPRPCLGGTPRTPTELAHFCQPSAH